VNIHYTYQSLVDGVYLHLLAIFFNCLPPCFVQKVQISAFVWHPQTASNCTLRETVDNFTIYDLTLPTSSWCIHKCAFLIFLKLSVMSNERKLPFTAMKQSVDGFITRLHYRHDTDQILELISDQESEKEVEGTECQLRQPQCLQEHGQPMDQTGECKDTTYRDVLILGDPCLP